MAFSENLFPNFFIPEFVIKDLNCELDDEMLDDCSYQIFYNSYVTNIAGVVCENYPDSSNSSKVFPIGDIPYVVNSQVRVLSISLGRYIE